MLEKIDISAIEKNATKINDGVKKYMNIMDRLLECDVSKDRTFQKAYNGFYRLRQRSAEWYQAYYDYLEQHKNSDLEFKEVLFYLYEKTGKIEPSFSSKLLATVNPDMPVWDMNVLSQLSLKAPAYSSNDRLNKTVDVYYALQGWYNNYLRTPNATELIERFDTLFPNDRLTTIKKVDLALWSMGARKIPNTAGVKRLYSFIPYFENIDTDKAFQFSGTKKSDDGVIEIGYYTYSEEFMDFIRAFNKSELMVADYPSALNERVPDWQKVDIQKVIKTADFETVKVILTKLVRVNRFSEGSWASSIKSGLFLAVLQRLKALQE